MHGTVRRMVLGLARELKNPSPAPCPCLCTQPSWGLQAQQGELFQEEALLKWLEPGKLLVGAQGGEAFAAPGLEGLLSGCPP